MTLKTSKKVMLFFFYHLGFLLLFIVQPFLRAVLVFPHLFPSAVSLSELNVESLCGENSLFVPLGGALSHIVNLLALLTLQLTLETFCTLRHSSTLPT